MKGATIEWMVAPFAVELNYFNNCSMIFTHIKPAKLSLTLFW